jgi:hypothetical protein
MQLLCSRSTTSVAYQSAFLLDSLSIGGSACFVDVDSSVFATLSNFFFEGSALVCQRFFRAAAKPGDNRWMATGDEDFQPHPDPQSVMSRLNPRQ